MHGRAGPQMIVAEFLESGGYERHVRRMRSTLAAQARSEGATVRVYTIAYGSDANSSELDALGAASGGKGFKGDTGDIESVYRSISSFF